MDGSGPVLILVIGLPGSGKTYFAGKLAGALEISHINSDITRKNMGASGRYSMRDKVAVYKEMAAIAKNELSMNRSVVVDATFHHHSMRDPFIRLAREYPCELRFIVIKASEALIAERLKRKRTDSEADLEVYHKIKSQYESLSVPHLALESTDDNIDEMVNAAVEYLRTHDKS